MDKLKSILSPGHKKDDETLYGTPDNTGKISGQGTHFGDSKHDHPAGASEGVAVSGANASDAASTTAVKDGVTGPFSETSNNGALRAAQIAAGQTSKDTSSDLPIYSEMTGNKDSSAAAATALTGAGPYSSHEVDPRIDGSQSHTARDTALGGGTAAATAAAATALENDKSNRPDHESVATATSTDPTPTKLPTTLRSTEPSSTTTTTHAAPISVSSPDTTTAPQTSSTTTTHAAPVSVPSPETSTAAHTSSTTTTPSAATQGSALPAVSGRSAEHEESHIGRDAAAAGGVGAVATAAYDTTKDHGNQASTSASSTTNTSSGPLGSLRDLINEKTGGGSSTSAISGSQPTGTTSDAPSSLPLGTIRPLIDEKTGSNAAQQTSASQPVSSEAPSSLPTGTLRPLIDEKTGSNAAEQTTGSQSTGYLGRDAGIAAGSAAGAAGVYEAIKHHDNSTDTTAPTSTIGTASTTGAGPTSNLSSTTTQEPTSSDSTTDHHTGRDAALGAATGAGLVGSYDYLKKDHDSTPTTAGTSGTDTSRAATGTASAEPTTTSSSSQLKEFQSTAPIQPVENVEKKDDDHHYARDAAAGAAAGGVAGAAYDHHKHEEDEKAAEKARKEAEKQHEKDVKHHEKEVKKAEKQHEKEVKAIEKQHEKEVKAAEKEQRKEEKALEKEHKKEEKEAEKRRHEEEAAAAVAGAGAAGYAVHEHDKNREASVASTAAQDSTQRDRLASLAENRGEGKVQSDASTAGVAGTSTLGSTSTTAPVLAEDSTQRDRLGSLAQDRGEGKIHSDGALAGAAGAGALGGAALAHEHGKAAEDPTVRDRIGSIAESRAEGKVKSTDTIPPTTTSGAGIAAYTEAQSQPEEKERKGSILDIFKKDKHEKDTTVADESIKDESKTSKLKSLFSKDKSTSETEDKNHHEKDAAIAAGAVGAGVLGHSEYEKHYGSSTAETSAATSTTPQAVSDPKVYRDSLGNLKSDPTTQSFQTSDTTGGVVRDNLGHYQAVDTPATGTASTTDTTKDNSHHGAEAAVVGAGAGALAGHEVKKHHDNTTTTTDSTTAGTTEGHHHHHHHGHHDSERTSYANHPDHAQHSHSERAVPASTTAATTTTGAAAGDLGTSHGYVNEHYVHQKTEEDLKHERRNDMPVVGVLQGEGRFHGKEGGAPGAVGVPPEERDAAYIESQKHLPILHGKHAEGKHEPNKLHKDPPAGHPAALAAAAGTGALAGTTSGHSTTTDTTTTGTGEQLLHGQHSSALKDSANVNVENPLHDPSNMGYHGTGEGGVKAFGERPEDEVRGERGE